MSSGAPKVIQLHPRRLGAGRGDLPEKTAESLTVDEAIGRHLDALYATARLLTGAQASAEDMVQETAIAAFRAWGSLRRPEAVKTWLLRILYREFLNHRRRERRRPMSLFVFESVWADFASIGRTIHAGGRQAVETSQRGVGLVLWEDKGLVYALASTGETSELRRLVESAP